MIRMTAIGLGTVLLAQVLAAGPAVAQTGAAGPPQQAAQPEPGPLERGGKRYLDGDFEEALADLAEARKNDPRSAVAAYYLGAAYKKMQLFEEAIPHLRDAVTLQPPARQAFLVLADAYYALDRNDEALLALEVCEREQIDPAQSAFLKGLVLIRVKRYAEARRTLEDARSRDASLAAAVDFHVATALHAEGRDREARDLFRSVADGVPESDIGQMARQQEEGLTKQMESRHAFRATANVQYQYDSNVVLKPDDAAAASEISGKADTAAVAAVSAEYALPLRGPAGLKLQYAFFANRHETLRAFDVMSNSVSMAPELRLGTNTASLPATYSDTTVDGKEYLHAVSVAPTYAFVTGEEQYAQATVKLLRKDFLAQPVSADENRDADNLAASLAWYRLVARQKGFVSLKYTADREDAVGRNWSYLGHRIEAGMLAPVTERARVTLGLDGYVQNYTHVHSSFNEKRRDVTTAAAMQLLYGLTATFDFQVQVSAMQADSNLAAYAYTKTVAAIGIYARY